ncbi:ABC transporter ATP-binding protein [Vagococcus sp. PNs007]|uniref:ABC transporter ATP-binding protein n=1 Tax=Vagococcus proximus TaxID=2991417 RepID=A0ABT5X0M3_9ENTE|nr:ABC transporter ATP-binding protein [Vagococcus proximus]MDF0479551.1 ABC transporter ATP-binding protein [Vagococcus proximus]
MLEVKDLSINYDDNVVLNNFNFCLSPGDFIGVLGSNGSGKSTLLNSLVGVYPNKSGGIIYNQKYLDKNHPFSSIGFSPQSQVMDWYLDVWSNVELGLRLANIDKHKIKEYCDFAIDIVSLNSAKKKIVDTLSGGQQQRVQIARAIAHKPNIYILDEPTTGLDVESSEKLLDFLLLESQNNKGVIISTHDISLLECFCTKILFIKDNKIEFFGCKEEFMKEQMIRFYIEFEYKITDAEFSWLKKNINEYQVINPFSIEIFTPNTTDHTIFSIINTFPKDTFNIKNISSNVINLRETYLNKVKH